MGVYMYSSTLSLTSVLDALGVQRHAPAAYPRGIEPVPFLYEAGLASRPV